MELIGPIDLAIYPFLSEAGTYLKEKNFTLDDFEDPDFQPIVNKAFNRILTTIDGKVHKTSTSRQDLDGEIFSFLIAVILLKQSNVSTFIKRFSLQEARRAEDNLTDYLKMRFASEVDKNHGINLAIKIIKDVSSMEIIKNIDSFSVTIQDYLKRTIDFHEQEWKLVNRQVSGGMVYLKPDEIVRLIRKELEHFISSRIYANNIASIPNSFLQYVEQLIEKGKKFVVHVVDTGEYPPCIKHALDILHKGENLPHSGRFMLATYLLNKGQTIEEIAPLFKNAPDYNEKITLYQLKHLAGNFGSGTKYACPSCEKLKSENLCFAIPDCASIVNPLQFGRKKINNV